ncbi:MAG: sulfur carrier protein ThiS [Vicinamibacteria bacterium]|nr:sulfur carrier protein ThiS [Vicinamibacteria bacterium]
MRITVNGSPAECPERLSVDQLLRHLNLPVGRVAVERNRELVRKDAHERVEVRSGDVFEIVTFVGGG